MDTNDKKFCNKCKCAYFGEFCPICKKNINGKSEPRQTAINSTVENKNKPVHIFITILIFIVAVILLCVLNDGTITKLNKKADNFLFNQPEINFPGNVIDTYYTSNEKTNVMEVENTLDENLYIKFKDANTNETIFTAYVSRKSETSFNVPAGKYKVCYASGNKWYGKTYYFGPETKYSKSDDILECSIENGRIKNQHIKIYSLASPINTNHSSKREFDE